MREIKFRALVGSVMVQVIKMDFIKNTSGEYVQFGEGYYLNGKNKGLHMSFKMSEVVFIEYTGVKDKNGNEIYEGDIFENDREDAHEIVTFDEGSFWLDGSTYTSPLHEVDTKSKEVIGNIYENPELLESEAE